MFQKLPLNMFLKKKSSIFLYKKPMRKQNINQYKKALLDKLLKRQAKCQDMNKYQPANKQFNNLNNHKFIIHMFIQEAYINRVDNLGLINLESNQSLLRDNKLFKKKPAENQAQVIDYIQNHDQT